MKYYVKSGDREFEVSLSERDGGTFATLREIDAQGKPIDTNNPVERAVSYAEVDGLGQYSILDGCKSWAASIEAHRGSMNEFAVGIAGEVFSINIENERERAAHAAERSAGSGPRTVTAAMPGIVIVVNVKEGDMVGRDTPLLILEAMKMQNEVRAEAAGKVTKVSVEAGRTVAAGQTLLTIAPA